MIDAETLAQMNGKYVMPPDAGSAWRAAVEYGYDMSFLEESLKLTPEGGRALAPMHQGKAGTTQ